MAASALLKSRCRRPSYLNKLAKAEDLIDLFELGTLRSTHVSKGARLEFAHGLKLQLSQCSRVARLH